MGREILFVRVFHAPNLMSGHRFFIMLKVTAVKYALNVMFSDEGKQNFVLF
jgi:hypothetical protein